MDKIFVGLRTLRFATSAAIPASSQKDLAIVLDQIIVEH